MDKLTQLLPHPELGLLVLHRRDGKRVIETAVGGRELSAQDLRTVGDYLHAEAREMRKEHDK